MTPDPYTVDVTVYLPDETRQDCYYHGENESLEIDLNSGATPHEYAQCIATLIRETLHRTGWTGSPEQVIAQGDFPDVGKLCADGNGNLRRPESWQEVA